MLKDKEYYQKRKAIKTMRDKYFMNWSQISYKVHLPPYQCEEMYEELTRPKTNQEGR